MFILLTSEESNAAEKEQLIHFFENGLQLLHVRKPGMTEEELKTWLFQFEKIQLNKMILHQHHHLAEAFTVKGIHLKEDFRRKQQDLPQYVADFRKKGFSVSSSFHELEAIEAETTAFDYVFLSPVFSSVSKKGYKGEFFEIENRSQKVIALGGIEKATIPKAKELGYAGVAVLGAIWTAKNKKEQFFEIFKAYKNAF